jgi:hypothetical protein
MFFPPQSKFFDGYGSARNLVVVVAGTNQKVSGQLYMSDNEGTTFRELWPNRIRKIANEYMGEVIDPHCGVIDRIKFSWLRDDLNWNGFLLRLGQPIAGRHSVQKLEAKHLQLIRDFGATDP